MKQDYHQLLRPEIVNTVSGLSLISRIVVDGFLSGLNKSKSVGPGMEFSQYRGYDPGDDLRLMDWKMLARSGRYYIKQSEIESQVAVKFIIDASASMRHTDNELSKIEFARILVASLAYISQKQGDLVGLFALNEKSVVSVYPKADKKHYNRLLLELLNIKTDGKWPETSIAAKSITNRGAKELIFILTDMYEDNNEISKFSRELKSSRNEVVVLHIMGSKEMDFDYKSNVTFEDLESGQKVKVNAEQAKVQYLKAVDTMITNTKDQLLSKEIYYHLFRMDTHLGEALQLFLKQRKNLN
tara:strand:- start:11878 stop:12774 length:897 start_codon:yes stop_codon:yes gene_type:complete